MRIEILTPERKLFSGDAYGVQLPGISGSFEVLEKHAPMVSALGKGAVKILLDKTGKSNSYKINSGFVEVLNNQVSVLVEGAVEA
jgi:F-type H+-transporting ATPase subunit epsilon